MAENEFWTKIMRQRLSRRTLVRAGAVTGVGLWAGSLLACGGEQKEPTPQSQSEAEVPQRGGVFNYIQSSDARGYDPHVETQTQSSFHLTKVYSGLLIFNRASTELVPDLAVSVEQPDEVTYIFKLNQGVKWQNLPPVNGREFTADDVKFSIERMMQTQPAGKWQHSYYFAGRIAKIEVVDKYTVKFVTNTPYAPFLTYIGSVWTKMVSHEAVDKWGELTRSETLIGTGPFMLKSHTPNVEIVLKRNPDFFKQPLPYFDEFRSVFIGDSSTSLSMLLSGQLDACTVATESVDQFKKSKPDYREVIGVAMTPFVFRCPPYDDKIPAKAPFNDKRVRQAIQLAINKQEILDVYAGGVGDIMVGMIPPDRKPWALPDSELIKQDFTKAKQLLAQAGYPNGFKTDITCANIDYGTTPATVVKDQLAKIGIDAALKPIEVAQYYNVIYSYNYNLNQHNMTGSEEPSDYINPYFGAEATFYRWGNKDLQAKVAEQQTIVLDKQKRLALIQEIQRIAMDEAAIVPQFNSGYYWFANPHLKPYSETTWNNYQGYWWAEGWWDDEKRRASVS